MNTNRREFLIRSSMGVLGIMSAAQHSTAEENPAGRATVMPVLFG